MVADFFVLHVADGVDVHHERNAGYNDHHHGGEAVHQKADRKICAAHGEPGIDVFVKLGARTVDEAPQHLRGQHGGNAHAEDGRRVRAFTADLVAEQPGQQAACKRGEGDGEV